MKQLVGYCGLDCAQYDARTATINNDDELRAKTAKLWCEMNNTDEIKPEHINRAAVTPTSKGRRASATICFRNALRTSR